MTTAFIASIATLRPADAPAIAVKIETVKVALCAAQQADARGQRDSLMLPLQIDLLLMYRYHRRLTLL